MASLDVNGLDRLILDLNELAELPQETAEAMLDAQAEILERAQRRTGREMGVHRTGVTLASIVRGRLKKRKDGWAKYVTPQGRNKQGARNAEVAFINEFGKHGQPARPFIRAANEASADACVDAAAKVYDDYLKTKNL